MKLEIFRNAADLQKFCVNTPVNQASIVAIQYVDRCWYLFYY